MQRTLPQVSAGRSAMQVINSLLARHPCDIDDCVEVRIERKISGSAVPARVHGGEQRATLNATLIDRWVLSWEESKKCDVFLLAH